MKSSHKLSIALFLTLSMMLSSCQETIEDLEFVWCTDIRQEMNITLGFQLEKAFPTKEATLEICAANGYMVFLDDEMVAFGPSRTAHGHIRKDEIRLTNLTKDSKLTVDVIGYNINSFCYANEEPYFAARVLDKKGKAFASSRDFSCSLLSDRLQKVERFSYQRDFSEAYRMATDRSEYYLGRGDLFPKLEVSQVEAPKILSRGVSYPTYERIPMTLAENGTMRVDTSLPIWENRFIDDISDSTSMGYKRAELEVATSAELSQMTYQKTGSGVRDIKAGEYSVTDAKRTITGFFDLRIKVEEPSLFYVLFDEIDLNDDGKNGDFIDLDFKRNTCTSAVRYDLQPGEYHLVNFEQFSARFLKFVCSKGKIQIQDSKLIAFENPDMFRLDFRSADDSLNLIVSASQNTLAQNGVDLFTDCPQRERAGWLCDAFFSARAEFLLSGDNAVDRNFLENYALAPQLPQLPEGMIPMCYPGDHNSGQFIPNWSMWYVLQLYDYYQRTGDGSLVEMSKDKIRGLLGYFQKLENEVGLIENLENWVFVEWSKANDFTDGVNFPSNMLYSEMLIKSGEMLGDESLILKGQKMKETIRELSFNGQFFEDNMIRKDGKLAHTQNTSETCQYYAFYFGIADKDTYPELHRTLFTEFGPTRNAQKVYPKVYPSNSFIGNYLRMELLRLEGQTEQIIRESKEFFHFMAERTHTLWEHNNPTGSLNHGFAAYAANFIVEAVTGIAGYDAESNTILMSTPQIMMDCQARIPFKGDWITVDFKQGQRNITFPEGVATRLVSR